MSEKETTKISFTNPDYIETKEKLDKVGCGMCLAKWTQTTIHLQMGETHSCHHPSTHKIPIKELQRNPSALHNTRFKKERRKEMLEGKRPAECDYCWNVEDNSQRFSDRVFKSNESWSKPYYDEIVELGWRGDYNPKYVEVSFSNTCNFKCSYCGPSFSSTWVEEAKKFGPYPTDDNFNDLKYLKDVGKMPIHAKDHNPYVEAFWKWWPDLYRDLHTFRITGGEPLLSNDTWKVLDYIINEPNPNRKLNLAINSNLGIPDNLVDKFIEKINRIEDEGRVNEFIIFTSVDSGDAKQAEYIRNGLVFNKFWDNLNKVLEKCPRVNVTIMSTFNALSVPNYRKLIDGVYDLKRTYASTDRYWASAVFLDSSYLRHPSHQTLQVLPEHWADTVLEDAKWADFLGIPKFDNRLIGFSDVEIQKIKRSYDWMVAPKDPETLRRQRSNFYRYFNAHDERRGTNFVETFPELADFYEYTKSLNK